MFRMLRFCGSGYDEVVQNFACEQGATSFCVRTKRDLLRPLASRDILHASEVYAGPLWWRVAGIIRRCADIMPRIAWNSGAMSMTAPFSTISRIFNLGGGGRCAA